MNARVWEISTSNYKFETKKKTHHFHTYKDTTDVQIFASKIKHSEQQKSAGISNETIPQTRQLIQFIN